MQAHLPLGQSGHIAGQTEAQRQHIDEVIGVHVGDDDVVDVGVGAAFEQGGGDAVPAIEQHAQAAVFEQVAGADAARRRAGRARAQYGEMHRAPFRPNFASVRPVAPGGGPPVV